MARMGFVFLIFVLLLSFSTCSSPTFPKHDCSSIATVYKNCETLPTLDSTLQYQFNPSNSTLQVVFEAAPPHIGGWVAWGLNPRNLSMIGGQIIACYKNDNGMVIKTYDIKSHFFFVPGKLNYEMWGLKAEEQAGRFKIYANVKIPPNNPVVYHLWQSGPNVTKDGTLIALDVDQENLQSTGELRLYSSSDIFWRKAHIILSIVCWGVLHQIGVLEMRYGKIILPYPLWYYGHICCTSLASIGGLLDFVLGLVIGSKTHGLHFNLHLIVAVILAGFTMVQLSALFLMPKKDEKNLNSWEVVHIIFGYLISFVAPSNIYSGFKMINAEQKWIRLYNGWVYAQCVIFSIDLIIIVVGQGFKMLTGPADPNENLVYGPVDEKKESGMQLNRLDNE